MTKSLTKPYAKPYVGVGGWTYEPWRGVFYPKGLKQSAELQYAGEHLTSIEVNGTFYSTQTPKTFAKWASEVPDGFVFSLKGPRYAVNRKVLAEAGDSIKRFLESGITELGPKLGPLLWQFAPHKKFDEADFGAFLDLLPAEFNGHGLRHVVEVRNDTFKVPAFIALARKKGVAICYAEHDTYTEIADITADFVYARLQNQREEEPTGYAPAALDRWAETARAWAGGAAPDGYSYIAPPASGKDRQRDVFVFMINGAKVRAPAAAMGLIERLG